MATISRRCDYCQAEYQAEPRYLNRNQGRYCSRKCAGLDLHPVLAKQPNVACAFCDKAFYLSDSKKRNSKSGLYFCSRAHKDAGQKLGGIKEIMPSHYGTSKVPEYRQKAFVAYGLACQSCGWSEVPEVLEVNHLDCNRSNNEIGNLQVLCPTCHHLFHFRTKTGKWSNYT